MNALGPHIRFRRRRQFCRVVKPGHELDGRVVEFSGVGRGWDVYAICDGVEHVFRNGDLVTLEVEGDGR